MVNDKLSSTELLFGSASQMGLCPVWISRGNLFVVKTKTGERYVYGVKADMNTQLASSMTTNKHTARLILDRHNMPGIPYLNPSNHLQAEEFLAKYKKIIVKPLAGFNSRDVHIVESPGQMASFNIDEYILEEYVAGKELRYLILDGRVIAVHESQYGESVAEDRALKRISYPRAQWDPELTRLSLKVAKIFGLRYSAVDYLVGADGRAHILEVNSFPGMKWFHAPTSGPAVDVSGMFLASMMQDNKPKAMLSSGIPMVTPLPSRFFITPGPLKSII